MQHNAQDIEYFYQATVGQLVDNAGSTSSRSHEPVISQDFQVSRNGRLCESEFMRQIGHIP
jgi:hypothetical protein